MVSFNCEFFKVEPWQLKLFLCPQTKKRFESIWGSTYDSKENALNAAQKIKSWLILTKTTDADTRDADCSEHVEAVKISKDSHIIPLPVCDSVSCHRYPGVWSRVSRLCLSPLGFSDKWDHCLRDLEPMRGGYSLNISLIPLNWGHSDHFIVIAQRWDMRQPGEGHRLRRRGR